MLPIEDLVADPRWRPFSVLVMVRGERELIRCPTPGHLYKVKELVEKGVYGVVKTSSRGVFTLERQLEEMLTVRHPAVV